MGQLKRYNGTQWENVGGNIAPKTTQTTSDTDTYSCNYINETINKSTYVTTETVVGTWIDDKPIYRKVLTNVTVSLTNDAQDIPHGISNFGDLADLKIKAKYGSTTFDLLSSGYIVRVTGTNINILKMAQGINLGSYVMTIIIEYTKTTN